MFGGHVIQAERLNAWEDNHPCCMLNWVCIKACQNPFQATRYHYLIVEKGDITSVYISKQLETEEWEIWVYRNKNILLRVYNIHPESSMTEQGKQLLLRQL